MKTCGTCINYIRCPVYEDCDFAEQCGLYFNKEEYKRIREERERKKKEEQQ